ncbi:hypothetical protein UY3_05920 [Chelonia mydas]|uniref:Uncharacterized protein n=1 Tax=Chelonia mydas TaxID=8469 RepID=M7BMJ8_CHEMY|nr:hypothetical protein UY3_05920 [Chelonia mydas]
MFRRHCSCQTLQTRAAPGKARFLMVLTRVDARAKSNGSNPALAALPAPLEPEGRMVQHAGRCKRLRSSEQAWEGGEPDFSWTCGRSALRDVPPEYNYASIVELYVTVTMEMSRSYQTPLQDPQTPQKLCDSRCTNALGMGLEEEGLKNKRRYQAAQQHPEPPWSRFDKH